MCIDGFYTWFTQNKGDTKFYLQIVLIETSIKILIIIEEEHTIYFGVT